ncbi:MAG: EamA family transporter [Chloroflexi bacterium]|nr:EamA family transporter [Chloroflexota bacterium]
MSRTLEFALLAGIAIVGWGSYGIFAKLSTDKIGLQSVFWTQLLMFLGGVAFLLVRQNLLPLSLDRGGVLLGMATGISSIVAVIALFTLLYRGFPVSIAYPLTSLFPLVTVIAGVVFLGESLTIFKGMGVILAVLAMVLLST